MEQESAAPAFKRTSADMIRETLADRIVHGILRPGEALDEAGLAAEFGVSRTPVREALRQLETVGFAASRPHRGAVVANLTPAELDDAFVVMAELEALCARLCAAGMRAAARQALTVLHDEGQAYALGGDVEAFRRHNERFHDAIYRGSGNSFLEETTRGIRRRLAPFRRAQFELRRRPEGSQVEHGRIVDAILAADGDRAAAAMHDHILIVRHKIDEIAPALRPNPANQATGVR